MEEERLSSLLVIAAVVIAVVVVVIADVVGQKELVDMGSVSDQELSTDDVVYMVFKRPGSDQWEELQVDNHAAPVEAGSEPAEG